MWLSPWIPRAACINGMNEHCQWWLPGLISMCSSLRWVSAAPEGNTQRCQRCPVPHWVLAACFPCVPEDEAALKGGRFSDCPAGALGFGPWLTAKLASLLRKPSGSSASGKLQVGLAGRVRFLRAWRNPCSLGSTQGTAGGGRGLQGLLLVWEKMHIVDTGPIP